MRALLNRRPSPALVISILALFMATSGGAVAAVSASGNSSASSSSTLWAVISSSGHIMSGRGVTSASRLATTGTYQVLFNRNVTKCAAVATAHFPTGFVEVEPRDHHKNGEFVAIWDRTDTQADETFDIQVEC